MPVLRNLALKMPTWQLCSRLTDCLMQKVLLALCATGSERDGPMQQQKKRKKQVRTR